jgi:hypothetical protein
MTTSREWGLREWLLLAALGLGGCATTAQAPAQDLRGDALVTAHEVQPLVAGPIKLLHANFDTQASLQFSRVWRRGAAADCRGGTPLAWNGQGAVEIEQDELICVAATSPTRVSWHARPLHRSAPDLHPQASLR